MYRQSSPGGKIKPPAHTQDQDGACFVVQYGLFRGLWKTGAEPKIKVTGYKSEWSGEVEITDATFEIVEGDTYSLPSRMLPQCSEPMNWSTTQNQYVAFKGMTVEAAGQDESGNDVAYLYNWDGSGTDGDDRNLGVSLNGETYSFVVESYLCDNTTDVYAAVKNLQIDVLSIWKAICTGMRVLIPHIISVTAAK